MNRIATRVLQLAIIMALVPDGISAGDYSFPYPANRLGWANSIGRLSIWIDGDDALDLGGGETLPLNLNFSSMQNRVAEGMLGAGWWTPLLESTLVQKSEHSVLLSNLGGVATFLLADPKKEGADQAYRSQDRKWVGVLGDGGRFDVEGPGGWKYAYHGGRISRVVTPSGKTLNWNYDANKRVKAIVGEGGRELLTVKAGKNGLAEKITVASGPSFSFAYGQYPQVVVANGMTTIAGIVPSVSRITEELAGGGIGRDLGFDLKLDRQGGAYKMDYSKKREGTKPEEENFVWQAADGALRSDAESVYEKGATKEGQSGKMVRKFTDGTLESYLFEAKTFMVDRVYKSGLKRRLYYSGAPGSYMNLVKLEDWNPEKNNFERVFQAYYDTEGVLLRKISYGSLYTYHREGEQLIEKVFDLETMKPAKTYWLDVSGKVTKTIFENSKN